LILRRYFLFLPFLSLERILLFNREIYEYHSLAFSSKYYRPPNFIECIVFLIQKWSKCMCVCVCVCTCAYILSSTIFLTRRNQYFGNSSGGRVATICATFGWNVYNSYLSICRNHLFDVVFEHRRRNFNRMSTSPFSVDTFFRPFLNSSDHE